MSARTLGILSAVVALLAIVVVFDRPRPPEERSDRVLPGFVPSAVTRLEVGDVALEPKGEGFAITAPRPLEVDEAAVADMVGTLEYLAWRRRVPHREVTPRGRIAVSFAGRVVELKIGPVEPSLGLSWLWSSADPEHTYLVEDHQARALLRTLDDLRRREALRAERGPLALGALRLRGEPPCVEIETHCARADADRMAVLRRKLADLRLARFLDPAPAIDAPRARLRAGDEELVVGGPCPGVTGELLVTSPAGAGCIAEDLVAAVLAEPSEPLAWVDRALVTADDFGSLTIVDEKGQLALSELSGEGARAWLEELVSFRAADVAVSPAPAATPGVPRLELEGRAGTQVLWIERRGQPLWIRRQGDPIVYRVDAGFARFFASDPLPFRDPEVLRFEPTALRELESPAQHARRGESIDDWVLLRPLPLPADPEAVERLRLAASDLRAVRYVAAAPAPAHRLGEPITLVVDPPPTAPDGAAPERHTVILGAEAEGGCYAQLRADPAVFLLPVETCRALRAPLVSRELYPEAEAMAVTLDGARYGKEGGRWRRAGGVPLSAHDAAALEDLIANLRMAAEAQAFGELRPRARVVVETAAGRFELLVAAPAYALAGRPVRYRLAPEACEAWPTVCR